MRIGLTDDLHTQSLMMSLCTKGKFPQPYHGPTLTPLPKREGKGREKEEGKKTKEKPKARGEETMGTISSITRSM